jgi:hypothetical protein
MLFNVHSDLAGQHAFLGPSKYHWVNYDQDKLDDVYRNYRASVRGTELHAFAHNAIKLGIRLPRSERSLNMYVNDAIGYRMTVEQVLYYSENCYGTADAISFRKRLLRIHDYKSGVIPGSMRQLEIYAALFCLEYGHRPGEIETELRIYQNDAIEILFPEVDAIAHIMSKIISFHRRIQMLKGEMT